MKTLPFIIAVVTLILFGGLGAYTVSAQSPTASQSGEQIRDAVQKQVAQQLANIKQNVAKKGFVGNITSKTDVDLVLTNLKNQTRNITITGDTTIKLLSGKEGTITDLKTNDFVIVMGQVDSQNKMTAKRLLVVKPGETDKRQAAWATVTKSSTTSLTVEDGQKQIWTLKVSSATSVTTVSGGKVTKSKLADVVAGTKIVMIGTPTTAANTLTVTDLHIVSN